MATIPTELDLLAPFEIWEIPLERGAIIKFHAPLVLQPQWMPDDPDEPSEQKYLQIERPDLGISAYGTSRKELWTSVRDDILTLWREWVRKDDQDLTKLTQKIKINYLSIAEEVIDE